MATSRTLHQKFKSWLALKTEHCKTVVPLFSIAYDRKLTIIENLRVRLHLYTCGACLNYVSNLKFMHEVFHTQEQKLEQEPLHTSLSPEAAERIKAAIKTQSK